MHAAIKHTIDFDNIQCFVSLVLQWLYTWVKLQLQERERECPSLHLNILKQNVSREPRHTKSYISTVQIDVMFLMRL